MSETRQHQPHKRFPEEADSLWLLGYACSIWALHFAACYAAAAIVCAKLFDDAEAIWLLRVGIGLATLLAMIGISYVGWKSWVQWDFLDDFDYEHDLAAEEDRHELLGHASFLLSVVALVAVLYVALPAVFLDSCQ